MVEYLYRLWNQDSSEYVYIWSTSIEAVPDHLDYEIDEEKTAIVERRETE